MSVEGCTECEDEVDTVVVYLVLSILMLFLW